MWASIWTLALEAPQALAATAKSPSCAFLKSNQAWLLTNSPSRLSWKQFHQVLASTLLNLTKFTAKSLSLCYTMAQVQSKELERQQLCPSLPILGILSPTSARYTTRAVVVTHTRSERGVPQFEPNSFHTFIDRAVYWVYPSFLFILLPASKALWGAMGSTISTPHVHLPIRLIKIKVGESMAEKAKENEQASQSPFLHFCSLSRS